MSLDPNLWTTTESEFCLPGVTDHEIEEFEQKYQIRLPPLLKAMYRIQNGGFLRNQIDLALSPIGASIEWLDPMSSLLDLIERDRFMLLDDLEFVEEEFGDARRLICVGEFAGHVKFALNYNRMNSDEEPEVVSVSNDGGGHGDVAPSFEAWIALALKSGPIDDSEFAMEDSVDEDCPIPFAPLLQTTPTDWKKISPEMIQRIFGIWSELEAVNLPIDSILKQGLNDALNLLNKHPALEALIAKQQPALSEDDKSLLQRIIVAANQVSELIEQIIHDQNVEPHRVALTTALQSFADLQDERLARMPSSLTNLSPFELSDQRQLGAMTNLLRLTQQWHEDTAYARLQKCWKSLQFHHRDLYKAHRELFQVLEAKSF